MTSLRVVCTVLVACGVCHSFLTVPIHLRRHSTQSGCLCGCTVSTQHTNHTHIHTHTIRTHPCQCPHSVSVCVSLVVLRSVLVVVVSLSRRVFSLPRQGKEKRKRGIAQHTKTNHPSRTYEQNTMPVGGAHHHALGIDTPHGACSPSFRVDYCGVQWRRLNCTRSTLTATRPTTQTNDDAHRQKNTPAVCIRFSSSMPCWHGRRVRTLIISSIAAVEFELASQSAASNGGTTNPDRPGQEGEHNNRVKKRLWPARIISHSCVLTCVFLELFSFAVLFLSSPPLAGLNHTYCNTRRS